MSAFQNADVYVWIGVSCLMGVIRMSSLYCNCCRRRRRGEDEEDSRQDGAASYREGGGDIEMPAAFVSMDHEASSSGGGDAAEDTSLVSRKRSRRRWIHHVLTALALVVLGYLVTVALFAILAAAAGMSFVVVPVDAAGCQDSTCGPSSDLYCCSYSMEGCVRLARASPARTYVS